MGRAAAKAGPRAPAMDGLPVRRMQHGMIMAPRSSGTLSRSSSETSPASTVASLRSSVSVRGELTNCYARMDSIDRDLTESSSAARGG